MARASKRFARVSVEIAPFVIARFGNLPNEAPWAGKKRPIKNGLFILCLQTHSVGDVMRSTSPFSKKFRDGLFLKNESDRSDRAPYQKKNHFESLG